MSMADDFAAAGEDDELYAEDDGAGAEPLTREQMARAAGWRPFGEWRGPPEDWVDHETFLETMEREFPVARESNGRLMRMNARLQREIGQVRTQMETQSRQSMDMMREIGAQLRTTDQRAYERARSELEQQRDGAVEAGDVTTFKDLERQIAELDKTAPKPPPAAPPPPAAAVPDAERVVLETWVGENPWFNTVQQLRQAMIAHHSAVRAAKPGMPLDRQLELARSRVVQDFPDSFDDDEEIEVAQPPRRQEPAAAPARRVPPAAARSSTNLTGGPAGGQRRTVWDRIEDADERATVKAQFDRFKQLNNDPDMPASEYVTIYLDPKVDVLELRRQRPKKA